MSSQARAPAHPKPDSVANLDLYRTRDEFLRAYQPVTAEEQLLVVQITRAWMHLQEVYELRSQVTAQTGLLGLFTTDFEKYKFLMRNLAEAERMWRYSVQEFHRARRSNGKSVSTPRADVVPIRPTQTQTPPQTTASNPETAPLYNDKPRL